MKTVTIEDVIERKKERLSQSSKKGLIRRNIWGIEQPLVSKQSIIPEPSNSIMQDDLEEQSVRLAAVCISNILSDIKTLNNYLASIDKKDIPTICKKLNINGGISKILESENVSEALKWEIIFNIDKVAKE